MGGVGLVVGELGPTFVLAGLAQDPSKALAVLVAALCPILVLVFMVKVISAGISAAFTVTTICPACKAEVHSRAKFCEHCGAHLGL